MRSYVVADHSGSGSQHSSPPPQVSANESLDKIYGICPRTRHVCCIGHNSPAEMDLVACIRIYSWIPLMVCHELVFWNLMMTLLFVGTLHHKAHKTRLYRLHCSFVPWNYEERGHLRLLWPAACIWSFGRICKNCNIKHD